MATSRNVPAAKSTTKKTTATAKMAPRRLATVAKPAEALNGGVKGSFERRNFAVSPVGLAGSQYHAAYRKWHLFPVGTKLELRLEPTNPHDKFAVQVLIDGEQIGYVEKAQSQRISHYLGLGMEYDCFVVQRDERERPYHQVKLQISFSFYVPKGALNIANPNRLQEWGNPPN